MRKLAFAFVVLFAAGHAFASDRVPTLEWWENFEHNSVVQLEWSFAGGTRVPQPNHRDNTMAQSIVPHVGAHPGPNSVPGSAFVGRYFANRNTPVQGRVNFRQPVQTNSAARIAFDWFPGSPSVAHVEGATQQGAAHYGHLAVQSINHFNSLNYLTFLVIPEGQQPEGLDAGLYFFAGTTQNVRLSELELTRANFISAQTDRWYRVELYFNFVNRTMDLVMRDIAARNRIVITRRNIPMANENYTPGQISGLQFFGYRIPAVGVAAQPNFVWESFLDNVHVQVFDDPARPPLNVLPFGVPQNVIYSPVTTNSVTINWAPMEADGFHIYRRHAASARTNMARIATVTDGFTFVDAGRSGPYYFYQVSAFRGGHETERTREAFIQLAAAGDAFTLISAFDTSSIAGFGNRIRLGDLDGDGRMDILLTNTLPMARNWAAGAPNWIPIGEGADPANPPANMNTPGHPYVSLGDGMNPRVIFSLTAIDIEGNVLWQSSADTEFSGFTGFSREIGTGADEPVQIDDVTGDGFMNVVLVANPGIYVPTAPAWINSVPAATLAMDGFVMPTNYVNRFYQITGDVFYILCGRTGRVALDAAGRPMMMPFNQLRDRDGNLLTYAPITPSGHNAAGRNATHNLNELHDHITLADLDGRGIRQHVIVSARYGHTTAFEMIDRDGNFVMNFMWQFNLPGGVGIGDGSPHFPLAAPLFRDRGDNRDWVINNFQVLHPETGEVFWTVPDPAVDRDGNVAMTMPRAHTWDPGIGIRPQNHMDSIWMADLRRTGEYSIVFGVDHDNMAVLAMSADGEFLWANFCPTEAQSANPAWFRTDADGMMSFGLDRRQRGAFPLGHDGLFFIDVYGNTVFQEESNFQGWMTTALAVTNWTGTFSPLAFGFNRNYHAIEYVAGGGDPSVLDNNIPATFFDGYFNPLFSLPELVDWTALRWMPGNLIGDSRDEFVSFSDRGHIFVFANGAQSAFDGITGRPRQQTANLMNWTRYNVGYFSTNFEDRELAQPRVVVRGDRIDIALTPVVFAHSYNLYKNGELIRTLYTETDDLRHTITGLNPNLLYQFTVTATEVLPNGARRTTMPSMPFIVNRHLGEVGFTAAQIGGAPGVADSTGIAISFDRDVTGLTARDVIVRGFVGGRYGRIVTGELVGSGREYVLMLDEVIEDGMVRVFVADFGDYFVTTEPHLLRVIRNEGAAAAPAGE